MNINEKLGNMTKEDAILIDINDWSLSGGGAQGDSFFSKTDNTRMLKLFNLLSVESIIRELELAQEIKRVGVVSPNPGELVKCGDRYGIVFERIPNKKSFCRAIADDPSCLPDMARRLAMMGRELHSKTYEGDVFISALDYYSDLLSRNRDIDDYTKKRLGEIIESLRKDERNTLVHGDFHFGNAITDGNTDYFIDLGAFTYGNPAFDISMLFFMSNNDNEAMTMDMYHITGAQASEFWKEFKTVYYGPDAPSDDELWQQFLPYLLLRTLFFEDSMGHMEQFDFMRGQFFFDMENGTSKGMTGYGKK